MCPAALRWLLKSPAQLAGTKAILVRATLLYLGRYALELKSLILGKKQWLYYTKFKKNKNEP